MPLSFLDISVPLWNFVIKPEPECTVESTKTIGVTVYDCSKYECRPLQTGRHLILQHGKKKKKEIVFNCIMSSTKYATVLILEPLRVETYLT